MSDLLDPWSRIHLLQTGVGRRDLRSGGQVRGQGGVAEATLNEFYTLYRDPTYWTTTIAFTATTAQHV
jgi:hypothetical protein